MCAQKLSADLEKGGLRCFQGAVLGVRSASNQRLVANAKNHQRSYIYHLSFHSFVFFR